MAQPFPRYNPFALGHIIPTVQVITAAANASPILITSTAHGYATGATVRIQGVTGNTAANNAIGNDRWVIIVIDANTFSLTGSAGNGAYVSGGTVYATPVAITFNHPEYQGQGYQVNSITFNAFATNTGNIYIGAQTIQRTSPFIDCVYQMAPKTTQNMPFFSPGNSNIIPVDTWFVDFDNATDGVLVSVFVK